MTPRLVLLPGLNGSGALFAPLLEHLDPGLEVQILDLPADGDQDYRTLAERLTGELDDRPCVLLGESFSGPLAYRLAMAKPPGLRGVIFAASFLCRPQPLLMLAKYLPLPKGLLKRSSLLRLFCLGNSASPALLELLQREIGALPQSLLRARLASLNDLQAPTGCITLPALQLLPSRDRLVTRHAAASLQKYCRQLQRVTIDGPHFLLQSQPQACARAIEGFIEAI